MLTKQKTQYSFCFIEGAIYHSGSVCTYHASGLDSRPIAGEACRDLFLTLQLWRLCISHGSHDHVNGGAISLALSGM